MGLKAKIAEVDVMHGMPMTVDRKRLRERAAAESTAMYYQAGKRLEEL
jgi:hypothetical protein